MTAVHANTDAFDGFSWHDNQVHGLRWELGDPERGQWHHRLVLDIDHIVEWSGAGIGEGRFRVAPASLVFEDVQDLKLSIDWGESGSLRMVNFNHPTIHNIERIPIPDAPPPFQGRTWRWNIHFNAPEGGLIAFIASGFRQTLRTEPVVTEEQWYPTDRPRPQPF
jgi:hypothetical protein